MRTAEEIRSKKIEFENELYAVVFPNFVDIETRGQNSHQAAQSLCAYAGKKFIERFPVEEQQAYYAEYGDVI